MRADVNVSVRKHGEPFRTRCEVKNVSSIRFVHAGGRGRGAPAGRTCGRPAAPCSRKPGCSTACAARPGRCGRRRMRTTTATSPTRTCCRWCWTRHGSRACAPGCRSCRMPSGRASWRQFGLSPYDCGRAGGRPADRRVLRGRVAHGRDAKAAANWVMGDLFAALNRTGRTHRGLARDGRRAGRDAGPDGRRHHQRPHRQGRVRGDGGDRRAARRHRGRARPAPGDRHRRDRRRDRRGACRERRQGRRNTAAARTSCSASSWARS